MVAAMANAAINGRDFVVPEDVKKLVFPVLNHRLVLTPEKEMEGGSIREMIEQIIHSVEVPR